MTSSPALAGSPSAPHLVLGATGGVGGALVRELAARGLPVLAASRAGRADGLPASADGARVEALALDANDAAAVRRAAEGAAVVYHAAQPAYTRWPEEFPPLTEAVLAGVAGTGAKLVFVDNLYMYGPHAPPTTEDLPLAATDRKGRVRVAMAERLLDAHARGDVRVTLGRLSDYYGPGGRVSKFGDLLFGAALAGQPVPWLGRLDVPRSYSYLPDVARALVTLALRPEADGAAWHLPAAEPFTGAQFLALVADAVGAPVTPQPLDDATLASLAESDPMMRELYEIRYQNDAPFVLDAARFEQAFGPFALTPHREALRKTVAWYRAQDAAPLPATAPASA